MGLRRFLAHRLLYLIPTMLLVTVVVFSILHLIPGNPVDALVDMSAGPEIRQAAIKRYGFDKPIVEQYGIWLSQVIRGDLGTSILHSRPVSLIVGEALPRTIYLAVVKRKSLVDYGAQVAALTGLSLPSFWLAQMLMLFFGLVMRWLPIVGYVPPSESIPGFLRHILLPSFALGFEMTGVLTRMTRSTMLEELNKDYVQTHRSLGLSETGIVGWFTLKNAMIPTLTIASMRFAALLGGTAIIEQVFSYPGIGKIILDGITSKDYPVVQGGIIVLSFSFILINLVVDILYKWLDPRIQME